ncbi:alcohol dehydrogenase catalytic domain-containing protein [Streptomyces sp. NBC_01288]|uniref:alcohol dehydrogenase catalytic domain-containing protein n=1 Tax=Streptomyces sp. NBC_01288 TaxID=2903814 RepID=UPI002E156F5D|nr:alcohol dehydrogenase catalytic domain-containing protein [Streptomyces sp. NBC_01288]
MRAAYVLDGELLVGEVDKPTPGDGQVLVRIRACAICASDLHFLRGGKKMVELSRELGGPYASLDLEKKVVLGHEFVGEIVEYGPNSREALKVGARVVSVPVVMTSSGHSVIGFDNNYPGGFSEYAVLDENFVLEVPENVDDDLAALVEPLAVGLEHARSGEPSVDDVAVVVGCGAIGLGVIAGLKLAGVSAVVAVDFSESRRQLALEMGAAVAIDPRERSPYEPIPELDGRRVTLVYECVGVKGLLNEIINSVGYNTKIVMGGYSMEAEEIYIFTAQNKHLKVYFASGETPDDMALALKSIADGTTDVRPWLSPGRIGLSGLKRALEDSTHPSAPIRTIVDPLLP